MFFQSENIQKIMHKILSSIRINPQLHRVRMKLGMERSANREKDFTIETDLD